MPSPSSATTSRAVRRGMMPSYGAILPVTSCVTVDHRSLLHYTVLTNCSKQPIQASNWTSVYVNIYARYSADLHIVVQWSDLGFFVLN